MDYTRFWRVVILFAVLLLSACAQFQLGSSKDSEQEPAIEEPSEEGSVDAPLVKIPNPYLEQNIDVSAEVKAAYGQALTLMSQKKWSQAQRELEALTLEQPQLSGPWVNLGIVWQHQNQFDNAQKAWRQAIVANGKNNDAYNLLALSLREQGKFQEAEALYMKALAVWPHSVESNRNLGILYDLYMGRFDEALGHYELTDALLDGSDRQLKGWIIDLKRRIKQSQKSAPAKPKPVAPSAEKTAVPTEEAGP